MTATELTNTVRELKELKLMPADIAADIETLEDRINAEMTVRKAGKSYQKIADTLNAEGIPAKLGGAWASPQVSSAAKFKAEAITM